MEPTNPNTPTTTTTSPPTVMDLVNQEELGSAALARLKPEMAALVEEELIPITIDIPAAVALVLGSLNEIRSFREAIAKTVPGFDLARFDKLETYTLAVNEAHAGYKVATEPSDALDQVVVEGERLRDVLRAEATALTLRGLLDDKKLRELSGAPGRKNLALDLTLIYKALDDSWPALEGKSRVTRLEIETAARIGQYILRLVGIREEATQTLAAVADTRLRLFTLFEQGYDDIRRALHFLRWREKDADEIAPSLYSTRVGTTRRRGASTDVPAAGGAGSKPSAGAPSDGAGPLASSSGGAAPATSAASTNVAHSGTSANPASGAAGTGPRMPGGDPFIG